MQDALASVMRPIALHVREEKVSLTLRRQTSTFSLSRQSSSVSQGQLSRQVSADSAADNAGDGDDADTTAASSGEQIGGQFMQPLTDTAFVHVSWFGRWRAARGGHES
ncbi:unnamed protein product [Ectocarpus fasciculatus]